MGRRRHKKVTTNGTVTLHQYYIYRGYLQIACCDLMRNATPCLWYILWDPTQSETTRPLAIQKDGVWYAYGWDITKNICEVYGQTGYIRSLYTYSPYGSVTSEGDVNQMIQWSSEYYDSELALNCYNYRYYNSKDSRWISRDPIAEKDSYNLYRFLSNEPLGKNDFLGLAQRRKSCCTITLYVDPPSTTAVTNNVLNVAIDTGHTWVEFTQRETTIIFSVGPDQPIGKDDINNFKSGNLPGTTGFSVESHRANAVRREWKLNCTQCKHAKKVFKEKVQQPINYTPFYQCTSAALGLLNSIPVEPSPPEGKGMVIARAYGVTVWRGIVANPYHLALELGATPTPSPSSGGKKWGK